MDEKIRLSIEELKKSFGGMADNAPMNEAQRALIFFCARSCREGGEDRDQIIRNLLAVFGNCGYDDEIASIVDAVMAE